MIGLERCLVGAAAAVGSETAAAEVGWSWSQSFRRVQWLLVVAADAEAAKAGLSQIILQLGAPVATIRICHRLVEGGFLCLRKDHR